MKRLRALINWLLPDFSRADHHSRPPSKVPTDPLMARAASGINGCRRAQAEKRARTEADLKAYVDAKRERELGISEIRA